MSFVHVRVCRMGGHQKPTDQGTKSLLKGVNKQSDLVLLQGYINFVCGASPIMKVHFHMYALML